MSSFDFEKISDLRVITKFLRVAESVFPFGKRDLAEIGTRGDPNHTFMKDCGGVACATRPLQVLENNPLRPNSINQRRSAIGI